MPKLKTIKTISKRFRTTKTGKVVRRKSGQDHYNSKQTGVTKRNKRRDIKAAKSDTKNIKSLMPYN